MTWSKLFRAARGSLTQEGAARALSGPDTASKCSVRTVQDWDAGRRTPPGWVRYLIIAHLIRHQIPPAAPRRRTQKP
jgi:hypothetical protein